MNPFFLPRIIICYFLVVFLLLSSVSADQTDIYTTGFLNADGWETNSPASYYVDTSSDRYHYLIEGGTGSYSKYMLPEAITSPFTLEFDVTPVQTDDGATFRFGFGNDRADSQRGPLVLFEMSRRAGEGLFYITSISNENLKTTIISSPGKSQYGGRKVVFEDGITYHVKLTWYPADKRVSITVSGAGDGQLIFSHYVPVSGKLEALPCLFISAIGDGVPGPKAEGFIDNLTLTLLHNLPLGTETPTPTPTTPEPTPTLAKEVRIAETPTPEQVPTVQRTLLPPPPTAIPTQQSGMSFYPFGLLLIIALFVSAGRLRNR